MGKGEKKKGGKEGEGGREIKEVKVEVRGEWDRRWGKRGRGRELGG